MAGLRRAATAILPYVLWAALGLLLVNMFAVRHRAVSDLVSALMVTAAIVALLSGELPRGLARGTGLWLGGASLFIGAAALLSPEISPEEGVVTVQAFILIACFVLAMAAAWARMGPPRLLLILFVAAGLSAAVSIGLHFAQGLPLTERLVMLGRANNPIPAAGAMAAAALAGVALMRMGELPHRWRAAAIGLPIIVAAMVMTQSRGPFIGLVAGAAVLLLPPVWGRRAWLLAPVLFVAASSLILVEGPLRAMLCQGDTLACRPSHRFDLWARTAEQVAQHPLMGVGVKYRLGDDAFNNPQNAALATAFYFGVPFLVAALTGAALALRRLAKAEPTPALRWAAAMMVFSAVYFAFEPSPFAFYNAHYLFLWLPLTAVLAVPGLPMSAQKTERDDIF